MFFFREPDVKNVSAVSCCFDSCMLTRYFKEDRICQFRSLRHKIHIFLKGILCRRDRNWQIRSYLKYRVSRQLSKQHDTAEPFLISNFSQAIYRVTCVYVPVSITNIKYPLIRSIILRSIWIVDFTPCTYNIPCGKH